MIKTGWVGLALLGLADAVLAQSAVNLYGTWDVYLGRTHLEAEGSPSSLTRLASGGLSGSRWGLSVAEDLGSGLQLQLGLEQSIVAHGGAGEAGWVGGFDQRSWLGLAGGFGQFQVGQTDTALDDVLHLGHAVFDSSFSPGASDVMSLSAWQWMPGRVLRYASPTAAGFTFGVSWKGQGQSAERQVDAYLLYEASSLSVALGGRQRLHDSTGPASRLVMLVGAQELGRLTLRGKLAVMRDAMASAHVREYQLGWDLRVTPSLTFSAGWARALARDAQTNTGFGIALAHALSDQTTVYVAYRRARAHSGGIAQARESAGGIGLSHHF